MATQTTIHLTTHINAALEQVFAYYADPSKNPEIWPSLVDVKDVITDDLGQPKTFRWTYKMAGMRFEGSSEYLEYVVNKRIVIQAKSGIHATNTIEFSVVNGKTQVKEQMDYSIPIPLLGKVAEKFLIKLNENEMATIHNNLKARMESGEV